MQSVPWIKVFVGRSNNGTMLPFCQKLCEWDWLINVINNLCSTEKPLFSGNHWTRFASLHLKRGPNLAQDYFFNDLSFFGGTGIKTLQGLQGCQFPLSNCHSTVINVMIWVSQCVNNCYECVSQKILITISPTESFWKYSLIVLVFAFVFFLVISSLCDSVKEKWLEIAEKY